MIVHTRSRDPAPPIPSLLSRARNPVRPTAVQRRLASSMVWAAVAVAMSGCGGGGASGGSTVLTPAEFETPEYEAQEGLRLINASAIYARGGAGKGVTVGMFDSGASPDHPELTDKYVFTDGLSGVSPTDSEGHGTHVAGIIAAKRDGSGMHGVAYDAEIASFGMEFYDLDFDREIARGTDWMRRKGVYIVNNSWGHTPERLVTAATPDFLESSYPESLTAWRQHVAAGGVQVWSAGNEALSEVEMLGGAPHLFPELEAGWLVVAAVDLNGNKASYAHRCGVAAAWCLTAPGGDDPEPGGAPGSKGVYSTTLGGAYRREIGTSFATPHVSGALAALKSLFPNLSYQQVRDRILVTANDSGIYADESIFGQGLLDLDAASRPVGGTAFALGARDTGAVAATGGARVILPPAAIANYLAGHEILILDNYQRAPFLVPMDTFAGVGGGYLSMRDLDLAVPERSWDDRGETAALTIAGDDYQARGMSNGAWFSGMSHGAGVMKGMAALTGVSLPHGAYRMAEDALGVTLGFASEMGEFYTSAAMNRTADRTSDNGFGMTGWSPQTVWTASFVPNGAIQTFGASVASRLKRPMGWAGAGALELSGDSFELAYGRNLAAGRTWRLGVASRFAYLATETGPLVRFDDALHLATELDLSLGIGRNTTLGVRLGMERPVAGGTGRIRAANGIDESGRIEYDDILLSGSDFLALDRIGLSIKHAYGPDTTLGVGVAAVQDGFRETEAIAGVRMGVRF